MPKVLRDGVLVDVDENGKDVVISESPVDGPAVGPTNILVPSPNSESNPVGVIGPLEGKHNAGVSADDILKDSHNALTTDSGKISDNNKALRDKLREEFKDDSDEEIDRKVLRKIETEGRAAADRDIPEARNLPHPGVNEPEDAERSKVREDGTVTVEGHEELTATYLHGTKVLITDAQRAKYDSMLAEMNDLMGNTAIGDIPVDDPYWAKKKELDAYVARLKR